MKIGFILSGAVVAEDVGEQALVLWIPLLESACRSAGELDMGAEQEYKEADRMHDEVF